MDEIQVLITLPFPDPLLDRLQAVSPRLQLHLRPARRAEDLPGDLLGAVEVLYTAWALPEPEDAPNLRWVQFHFAGVDHAIDHPLLQSDLLVTTLSGAAVSQVAEYVLMAILALGHQMPSMVEDQAEKRWADDRFERFRPLELRGSTVGIVGYGSIGREIARLARAFGATVLATKRDLKQLEDAGYLPEGLGDREAMLAHRLYPPPALRSMASECDFIAVTLPVTPETRGMVDRTVFENMKPKAYLIDASRGGIVDHGALVEALQEKRIAGAALDVYPVEPLPPSSPLWEMPNVILSPHVAGSSGQYYERATELFAVNLRRYLADEPLLNLFDRERGY